MDVPRDDPRKDREVQSRGYLVWLRETQNGEMEEVAARNGVSAARIFRSGRKGFTIRGRMPETALRRLRDDEEVEEIEADIKVQASAQTVPWSVKRLGVPNVGGGSIVSGVDIFVLDTGVQVGHPDINLVESLSFVLTETEVDDLNGHGTLVAGCAAAKDNDTHVVGVAPGARVHSYKVLDHEGSGYLSDIIAAIQQVIQWRQNNTQTPAVINLSLGGYSGTTTYNSLDLSVLSAVRDHNLPCVVAAGNDAYNAWYFTPSHVREALTVGAYNVNNQFSSFSNYGSVVDLLAPGENVLTTALGSGTTTASGTSFSCPYTAGALARYLQRNPTVTAITAMANLKTISKQTYNGGNPDITGVPTTTTPSYSLYVSSLA